MSDATTLPANTKDFCDIESKTSDFLAVVRGHELTDAERAQFDHLDWSFDGEGWHGRYVRFCGIVYRLDIVKPLPASLPEWFGDSYEGVVSSPNGPDIAICWAPDDNIEDDYTRVRVGVLVAAPIAKPTNGNGKHGPRGNGQSHDATERVMANIANRPPVFREMLADMLEFPANRTCSTPYSMRKPE